MHVLVAASLLTAAIPLTNSAPAAELQWRSARPAGAQPSRQATELRFQRPHQAQPGSPSKPDDAVRHATFDDEPSGLQWTDGPGGRITLRSVVVNRDDGNDDPSAPTAGSSAGPKVAQRPWDEAANQAPADSAARFDNQPGTPAGQPPADAPPQAPQQPALGEPFEQDAFELPEVEPFEFDDTLRSPADRPAPPPFRQPPQTFPPTPNDRFRNEVDPREEPIPATDPETLDAERRQVEQLCSEELAELRASRIRDVDVTIAVIGTEGEDFPFECSIDDGTWHPGRLWPKTIYMWKAAALCHKPLYFENASLERYGHSWGPFVQPLVSGAHFFSRLPVLPYCMGVEPPHECIYALGHYRPGSCAPYLIDPIPISPRGATFQAAATTGTVFLIP